MVQEKHKQGCKIVFQTSVQDNAGIIIGSGVTMGVIQVNVIYTHPNFL